MEYLEKQSKMQFGAKIKKKLGICSLIMLLLIMTAITSSTGMVYADAGNRLVLDASSSLNQTLKLSNSSTIYPGGYGNMVPQKVVALKSDGGPLVNYPVTFEISSNSYITALMRGSYEREITVLTDSNGVASASCTSQPYLGEGFLAYSKFPGITQTLQVKASAPGLNTITFNVRVETVGYRG